MSAPFQGVRAVFFDLDDTLCAYWEAARAALALTFDRFRFEGHTPEQVFALWSHEFHLFCPGLKRTEWYASYLKRGEPSRTELMRRTLLAAGVDDPRLAREVSDFYSDARDKGLALFEDVIPVLDAIEGKFFLGMITNGPADVQRGEVIRLGLEPRFQSILVEGELGFGKPNPEIFRLAERESGCMSDEIVFVGNSYAHDVLPALQAGWHAVWVRRASDIPPTRSGEGARLEDLPSGNPEPEMILEDLWPLLPALGLGP